MRFVPIACFLVCALGFACTPPVDDSARPEDSDDTTPDDTGPAEMPADPSPFTVTISGALERDLVFDEPDCYQPLGSANLRVFWRNSQGAHVFFLLAELMGDYAGPGTYDASNAAPRARLQEEAGGHGYYFYSDPASGDAVTIEVEVAEEDRAWGSFTIDGMHDGEGGAIQLSPMPVPIWCPVLN
jgi:hypothetical protein